MITELISRRQPVVAVSRQRRLVAGQPLVTYRGGDVHDLQAVLDEVRARAVVIAVTPFTAPPSSFEDFDADSYVRIVDQPASGSRTPRPG